MAEKKYVTIDRLREFKKKDDELYVKRSKVVGQPEREQVLSDNNLTDDLLQKIHNAGDSGFNGDYGTLLNKPTINGGEVKKGTVSKDINVPEAEIDGSTLGSKCYFENDPSGGIIKWTPASGKYGLVSVDCGTSEENVVGAKAMMSVRDVSTKQGSSIFGTDSGFFYCKDATNSTEGTEIVVKNDISDMATKTQVSATFAEKSAVQRDIEAAKTELSEKIDAAATSAYKPKGTCTFSELTDSHRPTKDELGNVYNISDGFITDADFKEGSGHDYPANTNVAIVEDDGGTYKYDALAGFVDLSPYVKTVDLVEATDEDIDALFAE